MEKLNKADTARQTPRPWAASNSNRPEHSHSTHINSSHTDRLSIKATHIVNMPTTTALTGLHTRTNTRHTASKEVSEDHSAAREQCTTSPITDTARIHTTSTHLHQPTQLLLVAVRQALVADLESMDALGLRSLRKPSQPAPALSVATLSAAPRVAFQVRAKPMVNSSLLSRVQLKTR